MEPLPLDLAGRAGPYDLVEEFGDCNGVRRCLGRATSADQYGVLMRPSPGLAADEGYRARFLAETDKAVRLTGPGVAPIADVSARGEAQPWVMYGAWPALPLPTALTACDTAFPEAAVLVLGEHLARALLTFHSHGLVYAGLCPESLLITSVGPQLTGYGLIRAAAPEGMQRESVPGMSPASVPREQRAGAQLHPSADIYALGAVLAYAATGTSDPHLSQVPTVLREMVADCLSDDPAKRPRADVLMQRMRDLSDAVDVRPSTPRPEGIESALGELAGRYGTQPVAVRPTPSTVPPARAGRGKWVAKAVEMGPRRRMLLTGAVAAGTGLAVGGVGIAGWRLASGPSKPAPQLAVAGSSPAPLWRYQSGKDDLGKFAVIDGSYVVILSVEDAVCLDLRSGKKVWSREGLAANDEPVDAGDGHVFIPTQDKFSLLAVRGGKVKWSDTGYGFEHSAAFKSVLAHTASTVWFLLENMDMEESNDRRYSVVAYRIRDRKEIWRKRIPADFAVDGVVPEEATLPVLRDGALLLPNKSSYTTAERFGYLALDSKSGRQLWQRTYKGLEEPSSSLRLPIGGGLFAAAEKDLLRVQDMRTKKIHWKARLKGTVDSQAQVHGDTLYVSDSDFGIYAFDKRTGEVRWRRKSFGVKGSPIELGQNFLSSSGKTLFHSVDSETNALQARDGAPLWRMATVASGSSSGECAVPAASTEGLVLFADKTSLYAVPAD